MGSLGVKELLNVGIHLRVHSNTSWKGVFVFIVCRSHFLQYSLCCQRKTVKPCSGVAHICGGALNVGHLCHCKRFAFQKELLSIPNVLHHAIGLHEVLAISLENAVHSGTQVNIFGYWAAGTFVLHLSQHILACCAME